MQKQRKTKYQIAETEQRLQKLNKYLLKLYDYSKTQNQFVETERKYQIVKVEG